MERDDIIKVAGVAAAGLAVVLLLRKKPSQKHTLGEVQVLGWSVPTTTAWAKPGDTINVTVRWKNISNAALSPSFRLAIKKGAHYTFNEGEWVAAEEANPGETKDTQLAMSIPMDWRNVSIEVRLDMLGVEGGVLAQKDAYKTSDVISAANLELGYYMRAGKREMKPISASNLELGYYMKAGPRETLSIEASGLGLGYYVRRK